jgi:hypothetical protein
MVKMDEFLATRIFFWVQIWPKIDQREKKSPSGKILPVKKTLIGILSKMGIRFMKKIVILTPKISGPFW